MALIEHIIFDLDGVLTDGKQHVNYKGQKVTKAFNARDKLAMKRLIARGMKITILTLDDWPGAKVWFENIGCEFVATKDKSQYPINSENSIGVGDDRDDWQWLSKCTYSFAVSDADPLLKEITRALHCKGGKGVVNHIENFLYDTHNRASLIFQDYYATIC